MHINKISIIITALLFVNLVYAEELAIYLNDYDSIAAQARIQVHNHGSTDYHDIYLSIDGKEPEKVAEGISAGAGFVIVRSVLPGSHLIKVTTKEGASAEKAFNFAKTLEQILKEKEEGKTVAVSAAQAEQDASYQKLVEEQQKKIEEMQQAEEEAEKTPEEKAAGTEKAAQLAEGTNLKLIIITAVVVIIFFGIVYYFLRGRKTNVEQAE